jgi:hypothetical protein
MMRLGVVVCIAVLGFVSWNLYWRVPGRIDFFRHVHRYDEIVQAMKSRPPPAGEASIDHLSFGAIEAYSRRDAAGQYTITLVTADWGHAGKAGYLFSDQPPTRIEGDPYCNVGAPGDLWMLETQVAPHWWTISNHLQ